MKIRITESQYNNLVEQPNPVISRTQTTNPDGSVTYKQSWDDTSVNKPTTPISKPVVKPVKKTTNSVPPKVVTPKSTSSKIVTPNSREITSLPPMQIKQGIKPEITAPLGIPNNNFVPTTQKEKMVQWRIQDYNKNKINGESFEVYRKRIQDKANLNSAKAKSRSGGVGGSYSNEKNRDTSCRDC
jgi:hypothetical protein